MKKQTRAGITGLTDEAHAGLLANDYSKQRTPSCTVDFSPKRKFGGQIKAKKGRIGDA